MQPFQRRFCAMCLVILVSGWAPAVRATFLQNAGFESGDFQGWSIFGSGWRPSTYVGEMDSDAHSGTFGMVNDVDMLNTGEWRGVTQTVPVRPREHYAGGAWIRAFRVKHSESYFEVHFLDSAGKVVMWYQSDHVGFDQTFHFMSVDDMIAPSNAVAASVRGVVHVTGSPMSETEFHIFDDFVFGTLQEMKDLKR